MSHSSRDPKVSLKHFEQIGYTIPEVTTKASFAQYPPVVKKNIDGVSDYDPDNWPMTSSKYNKSARSNTLLAAAHTDVLMMAIV